MSQPADGRRWPLALGLTVVVLGAATTLVLLTAPAVPVVSGAPSAPHFRAHEFAILRARPDADAAVAKYERFLAGTREILTTAQHGGPWQSKDTSGPTTTSCGEFPATDVRDAVQTTLPIWYTASPPLDPLHWRTARAAVLDLGHRFGLVPGLVGSDVPGNYLLTLIDNTGASAEVGVGVNATVSLLTGCHLTHTARERGTPSPDTIPATWSTR
jgi:hypothetical protein